MGQVAWVPQLGGVATCLGRGHPLLLAARLPARPRRRLRLRALAAAASSPQ